MMVRMLWLIKVARCLNRCSGIWGRLQMSSTDGTLSCVKLVADIVEVQGFGTIIIDKDNFSKMDKDFITLFHSSYTI